MGDELYNKLIGGDRDVPWAVRAEHFMMLKIASGGLDPDEVELLHKEAAKVTREEAGEMVRRGILSGIRSGAAGDVSQVARMRRTKGERVGKTVGMAAGAALPLLLTRGKKGGTKAIASLLGAVAGRGAGQLVGQEVDVKRTRERYRPKPKKAEIVKAAKAAKPGSDARKSVLRGALIGAGAGTATGLTEHALATRSPGVKAIGKLLSGGDPKAAKDVSKALVKTVKGGPVSHAIRGGVKGLLGGAVIGGGLYALRRHLKKRKEQMQKKGGVMSQERREDLPSKAFAVPASKAEKIGVEGEIKGEAKGKYPIPDLKHARNALARVSQHGTPAEREAVRKKVYAKFPELKEGFEERHGESPTSKENVKKEEQGAVGKTASVIFIGKLAQAPADIPVQPEPEGEEPETPVDEFLDAQQGMNEADFFRQKAEEAQEVAEQAQEQAQMLQDQLQQMQQQTAAKDQADQQQQQAMTEQAQLASQKADMAGQDAVAAREESLTAQQQNIAMRQAITDYRQQLMDLLAQDPTQAMPPPAAPEGPAPGMEGGPPPGAEEAPPPEGGAPPPGQEGAPPPAEGGAPPPPGAAGPPPGAPPGPPPGPPGPPPGGPPPPPAGPPAGPAAGPPPAPPAG